MPDPIPNIPLDTCTKLHKSIENLSTSLRDAPGVKYTTEEIVIMLDQINGYLDQLALEIQQDQSGEI